AAASPRKGAFGASGTIGSAKELIPGQCLVVVACGSRSAVSDPNVKYSVGEPWAASAGLDVIDSSVVCRTHGSPEGEAWEGVLGSRPAEWAPSSRAQREALRIGRTGDGAVGRPSAPLPLRPLPVTLLIRLTTEESRDFEVGAVAESLLGD